MAPADVRRKLTQILCADVVGNSRLMGDDPEGTLQTLTEYREVFSDEIQELAERNQGLPDPRWRTPLHTREPAIYGMENIEATAGVVRIRLWFGGSACSFQGALLLAQVSQRPPKGLLDLEIDHQGGEAGVPEIASGNLGQLTTGLCALMPSLDGLNDCFNPKADFLLGNVGDLDGSHDGTPFQGFSF